MEHVLFLLSTKVSNKSFRELNRECLGFLCKQSVKKNMCVGVYSSYNIIGKTKFMTTPLCLRSVGTDLPFILSLYISHTDVNSSPFLELRLYVLSLSSSWIREIIYTWTEESWYRFPLLFFFFFSPLTTRKLYVISVRNCVLVTLHKSYPKKILETI